MELLHLLRHLLLHLLLQLSNCNKSTLYHSNTAIPSLIRTSSHLINKGIHLTAQIHIRDIVGKSIYPPIIIQSYNLTTCYTTEGMVLVALIVWEILLHFYRISQQFKRLNVVQDRMIKLLLQLLEIRRIMLRRQFCKIQCSRMLL